MKYKMKLFFANGLLNEFVQASGILPNCTVTDSLDVGFFHDKKPDKKYFFDILEKSRKYKHKDAEMWMEAIKFEGKLYSLNQIKNT